MFADERVAGQTVARTRAAVSGLELGAALAEPTVAELQDTYDLLWYDPEELDTLS